jgi:hypothetical protein
MSIPFIASMYVSNNSSMILPALSAIMIEGVAHTSCEGNIFMISLVGFGYTENTEISASFMDVAVAQDPSLLI